MDNFYLSLFSAFWLGILTSISPCPLATNIAAVSFISRNLESPRRVFWSGVVYSAGRMLTYTTIAFLAVFSLLSLPETSFYLELYMGKAIGPVLIIVGILLLELIPIPFSTSFAGTSIQGRAEKWGIGGSAILGIIFALTFCPISAYLFFGSLIPLALENQSTLLMPSLYGLGTALPVVVFSLVIAFSVKSLGEFFKKLTYIEKWARKITAVIFIGAGVYLLLKNIIGF